MDSYVSGGRESGVVLVPNNSTSVCGQSADTFSRFFPLSPPPATVLLLSLPSFAQATSP